MPEKVESLEQAAREFLKREDVTAFADNTVSSDGYELAFDDLLELLGKFAAERERQVWAEATELVDAEAGRIQGGADPNFTILHLMGKFRERGEQVK